MTDLKAIEERWGEQSLTHEFPPMPGYVIEKPSQAHKDIATLLGIIEALVMELDATYYSHAENLGCKECLENWAMLKEKYDLEETKPTDMEEHHARR